MGRALVVYGGSPAAPVAAQRARQFPQPFDAREAIVTPNAVYVSMAQMQAFRSSQELAEFLAHAAAHAKLDHPARMEEVMREVAILDTTAPDADQQLRVEPRSDEAWLAQLVEVFEELGGIDLQISAGELAAMDDTEAAYARVLQALQREELVFTASDTVQALHHWVEVYRTTVDGHAGYRCSQALRCAIHLLRASEQAPEQTGEQAAAAWAARPDWGWGPLTESGLSVSAVPGSHISMMTQPHVQTLALRLVELLSGTP